MGEKARNQHRARSRHRTRFFRQRAGVRPIPCVQRGNISGATDYRRGPSCNQRCLRVHDAGHAEEFTRRRAIRRERESDAGCAEAARTSSGATAWSARRGAIDVRSDGGSSLDESIGACRYA